MISFDNLDKVHTAVTASGLKFTLVVTDYEHYLVDCAQIANALLLNSMSVDAANTATDKLSMRKAFKKYDSSITPNFSGLKNEADLIKFIDEFGLPVMIKPANLVKSLYVTKATSKKEALTLYREILRELPAAYSKLSVRRQPTLLVEECMVGSMHTVAGVCDSTGNLHLIDELVDVYSGYDVNIEDNFLFARLLPSALPDDTQKQIREVVRKGVKALRLQSCAVHAEIMLTEDGPKIIEIGARPGGYRHKMYLNALGISLYGALLNALEGKVIDLKPVKNNFHAVCEIFPVTEGVFDTISNLEKIKSLSSFKSISIRPKKGEKVGLAKNGFKYCANISLLNNDEKLFNKDYEYIRDNVSVILE